MDRREIAEELLEVHGALTRKRFHRQLNGFNQGELYALSCLYDHGGSAWPRDLSDDMDVSSARITVILNRLEEKGWIRREADCGDSRHIVVTLTESGSETVRSQKEELLDELEALLDRMGPEDAAEYLRLRKKMLSVSL